MSELNIITVTPRRMTERQKQVYDSIVQYQMKNGFSPTVRELCSMLGVKSTSTVAGHLKSLEKHGYIQKKSYCPRAIYVVS